VQQLFIEPSSSFASCASGASGLAGTGVFRSIDGWAAAVALIVSVQWSAVRDLDVILVVLLLTPLATAGRSPQHRERSHG
jgi:hypothetical protein